MKWHELRLVWQNTCKIHILKSLTLIEFPYEDREILRGAFLQVNCLEIDWCKILWPYTALWVCVHNSAMWLINGVVIGCYLREKTLLIKFLAHHFFILFNQLKPPSAKPQIVFFSILSLLCECSFQERTRISRNLGICSKRTWFRETPNS